MFVLHSNVTGQNRNEELAACHMAQPFGNQDLALCLLPAPLPSLSLGRGTKAEPPGFLAVCFAQRSFGFVCFV